MKNALVFMTSLMFVAVLATAEQTSPSASKTTPGRIEVLKTPVPVVDMILTGKVTTVEKTTDGKKYVYYLLATADGRKIALPDKKAADGKVYVFSELLDKNVEIVAKCSEFKKAEKKFIGIREILSMKVQGDSSALPPPADTNAPKPSIQAPVPQKTESPKIDPPKVDAAQKQ